MKRPPERLVWAAQPVVVALALWLTLAGPERTFSMPLNDSPSALQYLAQAKATIDHGWWWTNPSLGAPAGLQAAVLPRAATVDQLIIRVVGVAIPDAAGAVNFCWLLLLLAGGASSAWCFRRLGVSTRGAWVMGVLFALCPFALYYNIEQPGLTPYLVPFAATAALGLATRAWHEWPRRDRMVLLAGNLLLGVNGLDYAAFGVFFTVVGVVAGVVQVPRDRRASAGAVVPLVIVAAAAINLAPHLRAWQLYGQPAETRHFVVESEVSGLKIRQLVGPLPEHWLPFFREWSAREGQARFPYESENQLSRLGVVATVGFIGLFASLLIPPVAAAPHVRTVRAASSLLLAAFLLATVGGLGTVISLLVSPQVHVYSRITPFLVFFSLAAAAFWLDRAARQPRWHALIWAAVLALGLADQLVAANLLNKHVTQSRIEYRKLRGFVEDLEERLPAGAMVFQLPVRPYPYDSRLNEMGPYEHLRPYLVSRQLRWSYGALASAQVDAESARAGIDPAALPARLAQEGFAAVLVDRRGYKDEGVSVIEALRAASGHAMPLAQTDRYVAFDVRR